MPLSDGNKALVRLFLASNFHRWDLLPGGTSLLGPNVLPAEYGISHLAQCSADLGRQCYNVGCTVTEIRNTIRHLIM